MVLCAKFIKGNNLEKFIKESNKHINIPFIEEFLLDMLNLFNMMNEQKESHGDFHARNILVEDNKNSLRGPAYRFRVTDFGVASKTSNAVFKDDYEQLAVVLKTLLENCEYQKVADPRERFVYDVLNNEFLARHLIEKDPTRDSLARNPKLLYRKLENIYADFGRDNKNSSKVKMISPFDFPSLEQFGDSYQLLKDLYSELFLGLSKIEERNNLVLTGPRGCGKSTSFKSLSLMHKIKIAADDPSDVTNIGIYYRCDDLYFAFPRYKLPQQEEAYNIPLHFLTASLIIEVLKSIEEWSYKHFLNEWNKNEAKIAIEIWNLLQVQKPDEPGADTFKAIINKLNNQRGRAAKKQRLAHDPKQSFGYYFGPEILISICGAINKVLPFLNDRPFFFFIDDYSLPKISEDLQKNLNRLLMQRTSTCFFKIATESPVSYMRNDIDGKNYVEGREFDLLNLGNEYIHADKKVKLKFIDDIFMRRFNAIDDYPVKNLDMLLGNSSLESQNEIASHIRKKGKYVLGGKDVLCDLCSGDIHYIINLVNNMVQSVGGKDGLTKKEHRPLNISIQNKAIRDEAGNFLKNLVRLPGGEKLALIVSSFGKVAHHYLLKYDSKNEDSNPPHQASRIEPLEQLSLSSEAKKIYDDLLRYSVFIEDLRGKSRRGDVVPRLYLRRFLIPHFNLTFSTRDSIQIEPEELEFLLKEPRKFEKIMTSRNVDKTQQTLNLSGKK
jgi:energy-coupling factor transporter ATP-binding protein EcfA2